MDSELQIGLLALGLAAVVGIVAYNKWQERKHRQHAERTFRSDHRDVLLEPQEQNGVPDEDRVEPWEAETEVARLEPDTTVTPPRQPAAPVPAASGRRNTPGAPDALDARADCIIRIESIEPLEAPRLWRAQHEQLQGIKRPICWFAFDDGANLWRLLTPETTGAYHWFCSAMQMVDRRGAIGEQEFVAFYNGVQSVADQFLAVTADIPARAAALSAATELDEFCASVDVQVGVNIVSRNQPFAGTKIRALAEAGGMTLAEDGTFHARDDEGRTLFSLSNLEPGLFAAAEMRNVHTQGLTLIIDVPVVADGVGTFDRMIRQANKMAEALDGTVVDDNRAPFGTEAAGMIRAQIQQFQARMAQANIPAGGSLATRLFSA